MGDADVTELNPTAQDGDTDALASALRDVADDDPQIPIPVAAKPPLTPLNYAGPSASTTTREDPAFNLARRVLFAVGVGLFCGGLGSAFVGYERDSVPYLMGFGGALTAIAFKPWRLDAWS